MVDGFHALCHGDVGLVYPWGTTTPIYNSIANFQVLSSFK